MTFSDLMDCLRRSAFEFDARLPLFAWPADPDPAAVVSIVLASSRAPRILKSLKLLLPPVAWPRLDWDDDPSFIALDDAGGLGETTFPLSD